MIHTTTPNPAAIFLVALETMTEAEKEAVKKTIDLLTSLANEQCVDVSCDLYYSALKMSIEDEFILNSMDLFVETLICDDGVMFEAPNNADAELIQAHENYHKC